ncbi:MAG: DUF423 domain-containing protein [Verrucomicrobia bacterium]|nr:DUF423 domain-containing protein [Verrucomicrobiota bacterium]
MNYRFTAAVVGFTAVACGAFGAHALRSTLERLGTVQAWQTGALYHLINAVVLLLLSSWSRIPRVSYWLFLVSTICFSGSLYLFALTSARLMALVTPLGGLVMLIGWLSLCFGQISSR